jgi:hypothetical protein
MDLNINNYNINELIGLMNLPKKDNYNLIELQKATIPNLKIIIGSKDVEGIDKNTIFNFYKDAFIKLAQLLNINVPQFVKEEIEVIRKGLLPKMPENIVFKENNSFVVKHEDAVATNSFPSIYKAGIINPLTRRNATKILNINTKFRDVDPKLPFLKQSKSTDFIFTLPYTINKVASIKLVEFEFCNTVYNISESLNNNKLIVDVSNATIITKKVICVPDGYYTPEELVDSLNGGTGVPTGTNPYTLPTGVIARYNSITGKIYFLRSDSSPLIEFDLDFRTKPKSCSQTYNGQIDPSGLTLGWLMGYRKSTYTWPKPKPPAVTIVDITLPLDISQNNGFVPEAPFDCKGTRYFLISVNDYKNNRGSTIISPFKEDSLANNNIIAKIPYKGKAFDFNYQNSPFKNIARQYFGPVNLNRFAIKIMDEYGRIADFNNMDYSLSFELEMIYDL